ncbi:hypothetical protein DAI22_01g189700 [Oryza sativa Japonica Group]|uniref:Uncharacterized protein n=1 Tax=Oryza rufipogon TaxID=4529 RepID=A0A0E0MXB2_ORYRU|nr:hypothetical protein DAI22_01g189700 [Oryza sativa Japonica Group]
MVWKAALAALLLFMVVAANGEVGHGGHAAVPLRRSLGLGWMTGLKGGPPTGMQPSSIRPCNWRRWEAFEQRRGEVHPHAAGLQATAYPTDV